MTSPSLLQADEDYAFRPDPMTPSQRALSAAIALRDWQDGPWGWITNGLMRQRSDVARLPSLQFVQLAGPSALPTPYWIPKSETAPAVPASISWDVTGNTITPRTVITTVYVDPETLMRFQQFEQIVDGSGQVAEGAATPDPNLVAQLARALTVEEGRAFAAAAGTDGDPVNSIGGYAGIRTGTATSPAYSTLMDAYSTIVAAGNWQPTAALVSPKAYTQLRAERDGQGALLHKATDPLILDTLSRADGSTYVVPIVPVLGFPEGVNSKAIVADFRQTLAIHRPVTDDGMLVRVDGSRHVPALFTTDRTALRVLRRFDYGIAAGCETAVYSITWHTPE